MTALATRVNLLTGMQLRHDPTLLAWDLANRPTDPAAGGAASGASGGGGGGSRHLQVCAGAGGRGDQEALLG